MTDDITHNLTVVREALEAEWLTVHVKLIDAAIEDVAKLRAQLASARKATIEECAAHLERDGWFCAPNQLRELALSDDNRKIAPCDPNDLRPIWEQGLTVSFSSAYRKDET